MVTLQEIVWAGHFANKPSRNFSVLVVFGHTQCPALVLDITVFNISNIKYRKINKSYKVTWNISCPLVDRTVIQMLNMK